MSNRSRARSTGRKLTCSRKQPFTLSSTLAITHSHPRSNDCHDQKHPNNVICLLDHWLPLRRLLSHARRLRRPWPQIPHLRPLAPSQLGHRSALPGTLPITLRLTTPRRYHGQPANPDQLIHSVALLVADQAFPRSNVWAKSLFTAGITMFSGSIYCLVLDPQRFKFMGPVTPLGGVCLIGGWVALAVGSRGRVRL